MEFGDFKTGINISITTLNKYKKNYMKVYNHWILSWHFPFVFKGPEFVFPNIVNMEEWEPKI